ncbi:hypothetical protein ACP70R_003972 [Stipagrostis hirtigluma subsp. patula]
MAEAIVGPLLSKLQEVAVNEAKTLAAVGGEIDKLRDKLLWLQALVHETDLRSRHDSNRLIRVLASQIREVSFEAEDAVDKFYLRAGLSRKWRRAVLEFIAHLRTQMGVRFVLSREIQSMNARLEEIVNNSTKYSQDNTSENGNKRWWSSRAIPPVRQDWDKECNVPFCLAVRSEMIKKLNEKLRNDSDPKWEVIPVAGVGGVGKRALLRHAYDMGSFSSDAENRHFDVCVLMNSPREIEVSCIVAKIKERMPRDKAEQIRFLVVIDSPVKTTVWFKLRSELKDKLDQVKAGSKVLLMTTSSPDVNDSIIKLEALNESDSVTLFNEIYDPDRCRGTDLQEKLKHICMNIREITSGLPLAIFLLARLMTTMDFNKWEAAADYIMNSDEDSKLKTIMSLCIDDLPDELKSCLLFTAGFPKNRVIDAHQLVRLWMAEGFLTQHHELETEKLGQRYLKELIHRGLLQLVTKTSAHGDGGCVEQVAIHDQIHPLLRSEAKRTGFMDVHYGGHTPARSNTRRLSLFMYDKKFNALSNGLGKLRTVVSYFDDCHPELSCITSAAASLCRAVTEVQGERQCKDNPVDDGDAGSSRGASASDGASPIDESVMEVQGESQCRDNNAAGDGDAESSLGAIIASNGTSPTDEPGSKRGDGQGQKERKLDIRKLLEESPYLRVINLEGIDVGKKLPARIGDMVHLQYLGIRSQKLKKLPSSIGNLGNLQTIDVRGTLVRELPESLWKIQTLRHVLGNELVFPASGGDLKLLQTLETVTIIKDLYHKLRLARWRGRRIGLHYLHRLHVVGLEESRRRDLEAVLQGLSSLESLSLAGEVIPINLFADASPSCLEHVVSLEIYGKLPHNASNGKLLSRLTRLVLRSTNIKQDFIKLIAQLPDLAELLLHEGSYEDKELNLCTDCTHAFNSLTVLEISGLSELEKIIKPGRRGVIETRFTDMQRKVDVETCKNCGPNEGTAAEQSDPAPIAPESSPPETVGAEQSGPPETVGAEQSGPPPAAPEQSSPPVTIGPEQSGQAPAALEQGSPPATVGTEQSGQAPAALEQGSPPVTVRTEQSGQAPGAPEQGSPPATVGAEQTGLVLAAPEQGSPPTTVDAEHRNLNTAAAKLSSLPVTVDTEQSNPKTAAPKQSSPPATVDGEQSNPKTAAPKQSSPLATADAEQSNPKTAAPKQSNPLATVDAEQSNPKTAAPKQSSPGTVDAEQSNLKTTTTTSPAWFTPTTTTPKQNSPTTGGKDSPPFSEMIMAAINNGESTKTGIKNYIKETYGDLVRKQLEHMVQTRMLRDEQRGRYTYYFLRDPKTLGKPSSPPTFCEMILEAIKENLSSKTNIEQYINRRYGDQVVKHLEDLVRSNQLKAEERSGHRYYSRP